MLNHGMSWPMRGTLMAGGITLIGVSVALYRMAALGVDPFTGMNLGISTFLGWSFGSWQLLINAMILVVVFFTVRSCIGIGTVVNMIYVGYIADLICWLGRDVSLNLPVRGILMVIALLLSSFGVALYMKGGMGIAPYDSVAVVIESLSNQKIPFHLARILSDITVIVLGVIFCVAAGKAIWLVVGVGTVCNALLNGPAIQMFLRILNHIGNADNVK